jgi:hypothetical protein
MRVIIYIIIAAFIGWCFIKAGLGHFDNVSSVPVVVSPPQEHHSISCNIDSGFVLKSSDTSIVWSHGTVHKSITFYYIKQ